MTKDKIIGMIVVIVLIQKTRKDTFQDIKTVGGLRNENNNRY